MSLPFLVDTELLSYRCKHKHKRCPPDAQLRLYPMLNEDEFEEVDERMFHCKQCRERSAKEKSWSGATRPEFSNICKAEKLSKHGTLEAFTINTT